MARIEVSGQSNLKQFLYALSVTENKIPVAAMSKNGVSA